MEQLTESQVSSCLVITIQIRHFLIWLKESKSQHMCSTCLCAVHLLLWLPWQHPSRQYSFPADLEEVDGTTVLGKLDWTLQSTGGKQLSIRFTALASQEVWLATVSVVWSPHVLYL